MIGNCVERPHPVTCKAKDKIVECIRCLTALKAILAVEMLERLVRDQASTDCCTLLDSLKGREQELYGYRKGVVEMDTSSRALEIARQITGALNAIDQMRQEICS